MNAADVMHTLQFGDSMLPVGSFSFSLGLEAAQQQDIVSDAESLRQFARSATLQAATLDGVALLEAHRAARAQEPSRISRADRALMNRKLNEEMRRMTVRMGKKLVDLSQRVLRTPLLRLCFEQIQEHRTPGTYPVMLAVACAELGLPESAAFAIHQYGVAMTILNASLRLMKIDHFDAQRIIFECGSACEPDYMRVVNASLDDMTSFAPTIDVLAATHTHSVVRMFMS